MTVRKSFSGLGLPTNFAGVTIATPMTPTVASIFPGSGSTAGGETRTITGLGFLFATDVEIDGNAASFVIVDNEHITVTMPAGSAGNVDVSVSTVVGTGTLVDGYLYVAPSFALSDLPLTLYHEAGYIGGASPWPGAASAGTSASYTMTETGGVGVGPDFDGVDDKFESDELASEALGAGDYHIAMKVRGRSPAASTSGTADPAIFTHAGAGGGGIFVTWSNDGVRVAHFDGAVWQEDVVALAADTDAVIQIRYDGTLKLKKNGGAWSAGVACGAMSLADGIVTLGVNTFNSAYFDGIVYRIIAADQAFDDATSDNIATAMAV